jgi:6-phosphogluconate dehydrogenase
LIGIFKDSTMSTTATADIGLVGLEVMGKNLILNMADHGFKVAVHNRSASKVGPFLKENPPSVLGPGGALIGFTEPDDEMARLKMFVDAIKKPRKVILLVKAGEPTDATINKLVPLLEKGDVIIDGGNALYTDTQRREKALNEKGLLFVGSGVSGGEEGARFGPSLMPAGKPEAWATLKPIWEAIAAKVDANTGKPIPGAAPGKPVKGGVPCTTFIGSDGAGHYVKMVHNGIEYGDMQMICEAYALMHQVAGMSPSECSDVFKEWNKGDLDSFLIEITADVLQQKDPVTGKPFVDIVMDAAGQKGTGKWTSVGALDMGVPAPTVAEAVFARFISAIKEERVAASKILKGPAASGFDATAGKLFKSKQEFVDAVGRALYCSKICSYAQGFQLMGAAGKEFKWDLKFGEIAMIWRGGCIIRAGFLQKIKEAYDKNPKLANLLLDPYFAGTVEKSSDAWRRVIAAGSLAGVPMPTLGSALCYFDSYRSERLPANLLQAQRDFFGAHTYERVDQPRGKFFHLDWPAKGRPQEER